VGWRLGAVFTVLTVVGVALTIYGIRTAARAGARQAWPRTQGVVIGSRWNDPSPFSDATPSRHLQVRFMGPDGRTRDFWNRFGSSATMNREGSTVTVLVNPADFDDAVIAGAMQGGGFLAVAFIVVGANVAVTGIIGLAVMWLFRG
jgi:hypothetical protein